MSLTFPASPTVGDTYTVGARTWTWSGTIWEITGTVAAAGSIGTTELASSAVTAAKIADSTITSTKLASTVPVVKVCTSSTRPGSPFTGQTIFETDTNLMKVYLSTGWSSGTLHATAIPVEYLVIAGGGGGGGWGGGGGAGGYRSSVVSEMSGENSSAETVLSLLAGTYTVTVGAGGARGSENPYTAGGDGGSSTFSTITSVGGGGGGWYDANPGRLGGSGGGAGLGSTSNGAGGARTALQGFPGGIGATDSGNWANNRAGGGGGAGQIGYDGRSSVNSSTNMGRGGAGLYSSITGTSVARAGGGGGHGGYMTQIENGGIGGGGKGGQYTVAGADNGTTNTGGGGGGSWGGSGQLCGLGGSGVVIIRYLTADATGKTVTGGTATTSGAYTIRTFTASGSLVIA